MTDYTPARVLVQNPQDGALMNHLHVDILIKHLKR